MLIQIESCRFVQSGKCLMVAVQRFNRVFFQSKRPFLGSLEPDETFFAQLPRFTHFANVASCQFERFLAGLLPNQPALRQFFVGGGDLIANRGAAGIDRVA